MEAGSVPQAEVYASVPVAAGLAALVAVIEAALGLEEGFPSLASQHSGEDAAVAVDHHAAAAAAAARRQGCSAESTVASRLLLRKRNTRCAYAVQDQTGPIGGRHAVLLLAGPTNANWSMQGIARGCCLAVTIPDLPSGSRSLSFAEQRHVLTSPVHCSVLSCSWLGAIFRVWRVGRSKALPDVYYNLVTRCTQKAHAIVRNRGQSEPHSVILTRGED